MFGFQTEYFLADRVWSLSAVRCPGYLHVVARICLCTSGGRSEGTDCPGGCLSGLGCCLWCVGLGITDLAGVRLAFGFCMLARILCHVHVSDVVHVFVFFSDSKIEDQHARRVVVQQHSFRNSGAMECWLLGEQIATSPWLSGSSLVYCRFTG